MGNFQQHITCSTATGIAVAGVAYHFGFDPSACLVAAGLCSFAGMLPDIDSNTSKSFQECVYLTAGVASILAAARFRHHGFDHDTAMLGGAMFFLLIRFGLGTLLKKYTSHRGMIHSVPVAVLFGQLVFFVVPGEFEERLLKAAALTIGFLSHLILDEVYSIDSSGSSIRLKKSFGTALKWTNPKQKGLVTAMYATIFLLGCMMFSHPELTDRVNNKMEMLASDTLLPAQSEGEPADCEIRRAAAEFLLQSQAVSVPTSEPDLPPAMQIGNEWNFLSPLRPAAIVLP